MSYTIKAYNLTVATAASGTSTVVDVGDHNNLTIALGGGVWAAADVLCTIQGSVLSAGTQLACFKQEVDTTAEVLLGVSAIGAANGGCYRLGPAGVPHLSIKFDTAATGGASATLLVQSDT